MLRPSPPARRWLAGAAAALVTAVSLAGCAGRPARIDAVFLIVIDTLRPDRLSCYGYPGHKTPAMDGLAASGVRFENAQSPASWTVPAMGSILTSRFPTQLGLVERPPERDTLFQWHDKRSQVVYTIPEGVTTLASVLDDAGFHPAAFVNQPFINAGEGFQQGFAEWCYSTGEDSIAWHDTSTPIPNRAFPRGTDLAEADPLLVDAFRAWLPRNADRRPFVWVHLLRPHRPYTPLLEYLPPELRDPNLRVDPAVLYAAEVRETDDMVHDLLASIDSTVGLDHSLVILVADHGEEFLDHGMRGHGHSLHREVTRVPLIIAGPTLRPGSVVRSYASTLDLAPTVLELIGAKDRTPVSFAGASLMSLIRGGRTKVPIYSEGMLYGGTKRAVIEDGFKLLFDSQARPRFALYDVTRDPFETTNMVTAEPRRVARMEASLADHEARSIRDLEATLGPAALRENPETQRVLRAMQTLGYVGP
jgi:arylsulfatase A-like enzyme